MKEIVNGKKYDTDTAVDRGTWTNGFYDSDFDLIEETLYEKKSGEFFLAGSGGARTKYGKKTSYNSYGAGSGITPLTDDEAKDWAMEHLTCDEVEAIFGEIEE